MNEILNSFKRAINRNDGPAMAKQMSNCCIAQRNGIISIYELNQLKLMLVILTK